MPDGQRAIETMRAYTDAAIEHAANVAAISLAAAEKLTGQRFEDQQIAVAAAFAAQKEAIAAALAAQEKAVTKAELANEKRFEGQNEFRGQLADQVLTFMTKVEGLLQIKAVSDKVDTFVATTTAQLAALTTRMDTSQGRSSGMNAGWVILVAAVMMIVAVVSLAVTLTRH